MVMHVKVVGDVLSVPRKVKFTDIDSQQTSVCIQVDYGDVWEQEKGENLQIYRPSISNKYNHENNPVKKARSW